MRGEPFLIRLCSVDILFQLTRPVRGEPQLVLDLFDLIRISTHSPRAGRTLIAARKSQSQIISTHSPRAGRTFYDVHFFTGKGISTHSPRAGRTALQVLHLNSIFYFNSLAPCGANQGDTNVYYLQANISTHSPRAGRTKTVIIEKTRASNFNSLAPCGANR